MAVVAALLVAVVLPAVLTLAAGWRSVGLMAVSVLMFGTVLWLILLRSTWMVSFYGRMVHLDDRILVGDVCKNLQWVTSRVRRLDS